MSDYNFTDSTNNSLKEAESKENSFQEFNSNQINFSEEDTIAENATFEKPDHELKWEIKMHNTYHSKQDIERIWCIVRNFDILCILSNGDHLPCINIKGEFTWKVGNIFKGNFYKTCPFIAKVEKYYYLPEIKEIKWLFKSIKDDCYFSIKMNLYKVTENNSTVCLKRLKFEKTLNSLNGKLNDLNSNCVFKKIDEILEK